MTDIYVNNFTLCAKQVHHTESDIQLSKSHVPVPTIPKSHPIACHLKLGNTLIINIIFIRCDLSILFK